MKRTLFIIITVTALVFTFYQSAFAIPALQLYIEGATYYHSPENSWITNSSSFKLWVLGDIGKYGTIFDVKLVYAYDSNEAGSITFTPTTASAGFLPFPGDTTTPGDPVEIDAGSDVAPPYEGTDTGLLPPHSIYGDGVSWKRYLIGNFAERVTPIGDYSDDVPNPLNPSEFPDMGQINVYDVTVSGYSSVHFDAFDHTVKANGDWKYKKAPFSHDAGGVPVVPEPASVSLLGLGLLGLLGLKKKGANA